MCVWYMYVIVYGILSPYLCQTLMQKSNIFSAGQKNLDNQLILSPRCRILIHTDNPFRYNNNDGGL